MPIAAHRRVGRAENPAAAMGDFDRVARTEQRFEHVGELPALIVAPFRVGGLDRQESRFPIGLAGFQGGVQDFIDFVRNLIGENWHEILIENGHGVRHAVDGLLNEGSNRMFV